MKNQIEPFAAGVTVFGSSIIRVPPDVATVAITVSRIDKEPKDAFANARAGAASVLKFLKAGQFGDFGSSRITLSQEFRFVQSEQRFVGYKAKIGYSIILRDLDRIEELLTGLVAAGANELNSVTFETTRLKEIRADARKQAVAAAREKAELYCTEAGVAVGKILAIQDSNPDLLTGSREGHAFAIGEVSSTDKAIDPAMIVVAASVYLMFELA